MEESTDKVMETTQGQDTTPNCTAMEVGASSETPSRMKKIVPLEDVSVLFSPFCLVLFCEVME